MPNLRAALVVATTMVLTGAAHAAGFDQMTATIEECRNGLSNAPVAEAGPYCAHLETLEADKARAPRVAALTRGWNRADIDAYKRFVSVRSTFLTGEGRQAVLRIAPQRAMYAAIQAQDDDLVWMQALSSGLGLVVVSDPTKADQELNTLYQRLMTGPEIERQDSGLTATGLRDSQRAWLAYRDAWLQFARRKWPAADTDELVARLAMRRSTTLACLLADLDAGETYEQRCVAS